MSAVVLAAADSPSLVSSLSSLSAQSAAPAQFLIAGNGIELSSNRLKSLPSRRTQYIQIPRNVGVAAGRNQAAAHAEEEWLLFLDDDAELDPIAVEEALEVAGTDARIGAVAFHIVDPATNKRALWYHDADERKVTSIVGCANLIRRRAFFDLGGFWSGYFREMEEVDLSWRLWDAGWIVLHAPNAVATHSERTKLHARHHIRSQLCMVWRLLPVGLALRQTAFLCLLIGLRSVAEREFADYCRGLIDFARSLRAIRDSRSPLGRETVTFLRERHRHLSFGKRIQWGKA